jgi:hypothetical protein
MNGASRPCRAHLLAKMLSACTAHVRGEGLEVSDERLTQALDICNGDSEDATAILFSPRPHVWVQV